MSALFDMYKVDLRGSAMWMGSVHGGQDGPHNQVNSSLAIEAEVLESDAVSE